MQQSYKPSNSWNDTFDFTEIANNQKLKQILRIISQFTVKLHI